MKSPFDLRGVFTGKMEGRDKTMVSPMDIRKRQVLIGRSDDGVRLSVAAMIFMTLLGCASDDGVKALLAGCEVVLALVISYVESSVCCLLSAVGIKQKQKEHQYLEDFSFCCNLHPWSESAHVHGLQLLQGRLEVGDSSFLTHARFGV
ncbi:hypothetical protein QVD17_05499 [Tagetes erecta]|uniref:Uncharacterized protein n=1 Tax=Tagetes erecta TaxID=13708 RepID=A0AAD8LC41_TARER|nr:hypothetical protein QVD17_05499 [Tagetes erecta]